MISRLSVAPKDVGQLDSVFRAFTRRIIAYEARVGAIGEEILGTTIPSMVIVRREDSAPLAQRRRRTRPRGHEPLRRAQLRSVEPRGVERVFPELRPRASRRSSSSQRRRGNHQGRTSSHEWQSPMPAHHAHCAALVAGLHTQHINSCTSAAEPRYGPAHSV